MAKKNQNTEEKIHVVESALGRTERFIEENQKILTIVVGAIILIILGIFAYQKFIKAPREATAQSQMFMAQKYFEMDSLSKALNGDGNYPGFLEVIDDYGATKSGNLAKYYAGIISLKQGDFENAIKYLSKFKSNDEFVGAMAEGGIGDAYLELGNQDKAISHYLKAAELKNNDLTTPLYLMRAAMVYEMAGNYDKAIELYEKIKTKHFKSAEAKDIEKYIALAKAKKGTK